MFFDIVLDGVTPVYSGTRKDTVQWLKDHPEHGDKQVVEGRRKYQYSVKDYLKVFSEE